MRTIQIDSESLRISASSERALHILDRHNGCAMASEVTHRRTGGWFDHAKVSPDLGIEICEHHIVGASSLDRMPPWVRAEAEAHPRARKLIYVSPETYQRFDDIIDALRASRNR